MVEISSHTAQSADAVQPTRTEPAIRIENLSFSYDGEPVLQDINMTLEPGLFCVMLGPNGGGKTTLVKILLGLLAPTQGTVRVLGKDPAKERTPIGYAPQHVNASATLPVTAAQVVAMGLPRPRGLLPKRAGVNRDKVRRALEQVEMERYARHRYDDLSGGQKQRVLVARAIVGEPDILLFDEPTANVDPHGKICLFNIMANLGAHRTVIVVSHDLIAVSTRVDAVAALNRRLILNRSDRLTPEMLTLLYGVHGHECPIDDSMRGLVACMAHADILGQAHHGDHPPDTRKES